MSARYYLAIIGCAALLSLAPLPVAAQLPGLDGSVKAGGDEKTAEGRLVVSAQFSAAKGESPARLFITAEVQPGWHIYSVTQQKGGPLRTKIKLPPSDAYRLKEADFKAVPPPERHFYNDIWKDLPVEEHKGRVTWHVPIELAAGIDPKNLVIEGKLNAQRCKDFCLPPTDFPFKAKLGPGVDLDEQAAAVGLGDHAPLDLLGSLGPKDSDGYRSPNSHATLTGSIEPRVVSPGGEAVLTLRAEPETGWHVYPWAAEDPKKGSKPTLIVLQDQPWAEPTAAGNLKKVTVDKGAAKEVHAEPVAWRIKIKIPADASAGPFPIKGFIGYQTCLGNKQCDPPQGASFSAVAQVALTPVEGTTALQFSPGTYAQVSELATAARPAATAVATDENSAAEVDAEAGVASATNQVDEDLLRKNVATVDDEAQSSLPLMLAFGFLGGLILNLMPCVLPVIGLKIMTFVQQSGQDRRQVLMLNVWYSLGLMSVFMLLAVLAATLGFGWGELFRYPEFNIGLAAIVFVMGLSFLGVWEIPIPGFVGSGKASDLAAQEGPVAAYVKGLLTTVLATPCTGPFLAPALAFAVRQPPHVIYMVFAAVGLGMASPYLVVGAFPNLVRFLPKPGAWMETFKQLMGFMLFGTVVYLFTFIPWAYVVPTIAMLMGLGAACWWIGRTPLTADTSSRAIAWASSSVFAIIMALVSFTWLHDVMADRFQRAVEQAIAKSKSMGPARPVAAGSNDLAWQPYSLKMLNQLTAQRKTVLVDFTADWCLTCKTLEKTVLNTAGTREIMESNGVVPLVADWTNGEDDVEVTQMLELLGGKQVPTLAIFPAGKPNQPIVLRGFYTHQQLADVLKEAGTSSSDADTTAMNDDPAMQALR